MKVPSRSSLLTEVGVLDLAGRDLRLGVKGAGSGVAVLADPLPKMFCVIFCFIWITVDGDIGSCGSSGGTGPEGLVFGSFNSLASGCGSWGWITTAGPLMETLGLPSPKLRLQEVHLLSRLQALPEVALPKEFGRQTKDHLSNFVRPAAKT